uniref:FTH domain-containing protein n=1 Tax=Rhabditophanes sp. KR3021 TaxID=114890 RepID=A0AC35U422_9BILA
MVSTNGTFMYKALEIPYIYEKCISDFKSLIQFSLLNKKNKQIVDDIPIIEIKKDLNPFYCKVEININNEDSSGVFFRKIFYSDATFVDLVLQQNKAFFDNLSFIKFEFTVFNVAITKKRIKVLNEMINHFLIRTTRLKEIKIITNFNRTSPSGYGYQNIYNLSNIIELICSFKIKNLSKIELCLNKMELVTHILEKSKCYEGQLLSKFKKLKQCLIRFPMPSYSDFHKFDNDGFTKALELFNPTIIFMNIKSERNLLNECFNYLSILRKKGKQSFISLFFLLNITNEREIFEYLTDPLNIDNEECEFKYSPCEFIRSISNVSTTGNFKFVKNLHIKGFFDDDVAFLLNQDSDKYRNFREKLSLMINLHVLYFELEYHTPVLSFLEQIKEFICCFSNTVQYLKIRTFNFNTSGGFNERIAKAYPNLKFLGFLQNMWLDEMGHHSQQIESNFFMVFQNIEVLSISCVKNRQITFPNKLRKIVIDCQCNFNFFDTRKFDTTNYIESLDQKYKSIANFKADFEKLPNHKDCLCSNVNTSLKNVYVVHYIKDQVKYIFFKNTNDWSLHKKHHRKQYLDRKYEKYYFDEK